MTITIPDFWLGIIVGVLAGFAICVVLFWAAARYASENETHHYEDDE